MYLAFGPILKDKSEKCVYICVIGNGLTRFAQSDYRGFSTKISVSGVILGMSGGQGWVGIK